MQQLTRPVVVGGAGASGSPLDYRARTATRSAPGLGDAARDAFAFVLAGGRGSRLGPLTDARAKPAVPFAGSLRIIDFTLSNCVNSGIRRIAVLTQYKAQSLIRHVERGWGFMAASLGEFVDVAPAQQRIGDAWYRGTADAVHQNLALSREAGAKQVVILAGDQVYKMDYSVMLGEHRRSGAQLTVACVDIPIEQASAFGVVGIDREGRVVAFSEKPAWPAPIPEAPSRALVNMSVYVFDADFLAEVLERDAADPGSSHDFGKDVLPSLVGRYRLRVHHFRDSCVNRVDDMHYWRDVGTVDAYWEANLDLTRVVPQLNLYDDQWPILSLQPQLPPAKFVFDGDERRGMAVDSIVTSGCIVSGATVRRSILFSKVRVGDYSLIEDSVVLPDVVVGRHVRLRRTVVDEHCVLPDGFAAGMDADADRARFHVTGHGITLITPEMLDGVSSMQIHPSA